MSTLSPIAVRKYGARGDEIVVLHGGPGAPGSAGGLARALAARFRVLEPWQRRSGEVPLSVAQHVHDLSVVAPSPAVVVGHSWGAMLGLSYAAEYPDSVSKLVLVGCGTYEEATRSQLRETLHERLGDGGRQRLAELDVRLAGETDASRRDAVLAQLGALHAELDSYDVLPEIDAADALPIDAAGHSETWNDALRLQRDGVEPAAFSRIHARVLMVHGAFDPHPGRATAKLLRRYVPELEYVELERCGHEPWRERHGCEPFLAAVTQWLQQP